MGAIVALAVSVLFTSWIIWMATRDRSKDHDD